MTFDFKSKAVDFVRKNNCAVSVPVELIEKAMEQGAAMAIRKATERLAVARDELKQQRERNIGK